MLDCSRLKLKVCSTDSQCHQKQENTTENDFIYRILLFFSWTSWTECGPPARDCAPLIYSIPTELALPWVGKMSTVTATTYSLSLLTKSELRYGQMEFEVVEGWFCRTSGSPV